MRRARYLSTAKSCDHVNDASRLAGLTHAMPATKRLGGPSYGGLNILLETIKMFVNLLLVHALHQQTVKRFAKPGLRQVIFDRQRDRRPAVLLVERIEPAAGPRACSLSVVNSSRIVSGL